MDSSSIKTHTDDMREFLNFVVDSTKNSSTHHRLESDAETLTHAILHEHQKNIVAASKNSRSEAVIFSYALGTEYQGAPVYDLMFPNKYLLDQFIRFKLQPVFERLQKFFAPFEVYHKVYQLTTKGAKVTMKEVDFDQTDVYIFTNTGTLNIHKGEYILDIDENAPIDVDDEPDTNDLEEISYVGSIVVSWEKHLNN